MSLLLVIPSNYVSSAGIVFEFFFSLRYSTHNSHSFILKCNFDEFYTSLCNDEFYKVNIFNFILLQIVL